METKKSTQRRRRTTVIGANRHLQKTIEQSLYSLTRCSHYGSVKQLPAHLTTDLMLYTLHEPHFDALQELIDCLEKYPGLPVILLARNLDANHAVELIKCGVSDYIEIPFKQLSLRRKVERLLLNVRRPAIDSWTLLPFVEYQSKSNLWTKDSNRRHCYRANTILNMAPLVELNLSDAPCQSRLNDISIKTDNWLGGMKLKLDEDSQYNIVQEFQKQTYPLLDLNIHLPKLETPIAAQGQPIFRPQNAQGNFEEIVLQYQLVNQTDEKKLQSFWMECQRKSL